MYANISRNNFRFFLLGIFLQFCFVISISGQTITGTVISDLSEPLVGTFISIPHTNIGTTTNYKGKYSITIDSNYNTLRFYAIGYEPQEIYINKDTIINITLEESPTELKEIIIKGISVSQRYNPQGQIIKNNGLLRKADTINAGLPDSTFNRIEAERTRKIIDSINTHKLNDSINFIENITSIEKDFRKYIIDSLEYPKSALDNDVYGIVYVKFSINEDNRISNIKILKGIEPTLNNEVVSVLENMPDTIKTEFGKYGKYYNRQISKKYTIKIRFELIEIK